MVDWNIERLKSSHERGAFTCGNESLDNFLKTLVFQYERRRLGRTFVALKPDDPNVWGYYTGSSGSLAPATLPDKARVKLPKHPAPTAHLGRLAVHLSCQGKGLGEHLLFHFLQKAIAVSEQFGVYAVDVFATDINAKRFYLKYGFIELVDSPLHLYLPMPTVEGMFRP